MTTDVAALAEEREHTVEQAADLIGMSAWWLRRECREGRAPHRMRGKRYLFTDAHVAAIKAASERTPTAQPETGVQSARTSRRAGVS